MRYFDAGPRLRAKSLIVAAAGGWCLVMVTAATRVMGLAASKRVIQPGTSQPRQAAGAVKE